MLHEPAAQSGPDPGSSFKARLGVWMFFLYAAIYAGFVAINLACPLAMETTVLAGMNLATVYGIGLIVVALLLALVYDRICSVRERQLAGQEGGR